MGTFEYTSELRELTNKYLMCFINFTARLYAECLISFISKSKQVK